MTKKLGIYKCEKCGNIVEVMHEGPGALVCCGVEMKYYGENTMDAATEKHVPVIEGDEKGVTVKVGSVAHPMEEKHYIEWIEVINGDYVNRKYLKPGEKPEAKFYVPMQKGLIVRAYCNIHGHWQYEVK